MLAVAPFAWPGISEADLCPYCAIPELRLEPSSRLNIRRILIQHYRSAKGRRWLSGSLPSRTPKRWRRASTDCRTRTAGRMRIRNSRHISRRHLNCYACGRLDARYCDKQQRTTYGSAALTESGRARLSGSPPSRAPQRMRSASTTTCESKRPPLTSPSYG